jgi:hypothetical protein
LTSGQVISIVVSMFETAAGGTGTLSIVRAP